MFDDPTRARTEAAIKHALSALALTLVGAYVCVYLMSVGAAAFVIWCVGVLTYAMFLLAIFCCARARVLGWDYRHLAPEDDDDTRGFRGGGIRPHPPQPPNSIDWDAFERDFWQHVERAPTAISQEEAAGAGASSKSAFTAPTRRTSAGARQRACVDAR